MDNDEANLKAREKWEKTKWRQPRDVMAAGLYWAYRGDKVYPVILIEREGKKYTARKFGGEDEPWDDFDCFYGPFPYPDRGEAPKSFDVASGVIPKQRPPGPPIPPTPD